MLDILIRSLIIYHFYQIKSHYIMEMRKCAEDKTSFFRILRKPKRGLSALKFTVIMYLILVTIQSFFLQLKLF